MGASNFLKDIKIGDIVGLLEENFGSKPTPSNDHLSDERTPRARFQTRDDQMKARNDTARRFRLIRDVDASGVSGTGWVATGIQFVDGAVALRWATKTASTAVYDSIEDVVAIHGHEGATTVVWID